MSAVPTVLGILKSLLFAVLTFHQETTGMTVQNSQTFDLSVGGTVCIAFP